MPTASAPPAPAEPVSAAGGAGHVDWLRSELHVIGPTGVVARFRADAVGAGVVPWTLDLDRLEEDFFLLMVAQAAGERAISVAGARILARRLRDDDARNHERALSRRLTDRRCPFDLHALLPVPDSVLRLGPDDPAVRAWLWSHWGTPRPLRRVRALPAAGDRRRRQTDRMRIEFWSADWTRGRRCGDCGQAGPACGWTCCRTTPPMDEHAASPTEASADWAYPAGQGVTPSPRPDALPVLSVEGFEGPLDFLLELVRRHRIDLR